MSRLGLAALLLMIGLLACTSEEARLAEHLARGEAFLTEKKWREADLEFSNALSLDPNSATAHYGKARAHVGTEDSRRAFWEFSETVRLDPANVEARLRQGEFLLFGKKGDLEQAAASADAILAIDAKRWEALLLKARALASLGRGDEALAVLRVAVDTAPDQPAPLLLLAEQLRRGGEMEEAEAAFVKLAERHPSPGSLSALAFFLGAAGRDAEAEAAFRKAIEIAKPEERIQARSTLATYLMARGRSTDAEAVLESALAEEPGNQELIYALARFYHGAGRTAEADRMIEAAARAKPDDPAPLLALSSYRGRIGDLAGALEAADRAIAVAPEDTSAKLRRAELLVDLGFRENDPARIAEGQAIVDAILAAEDGKPEGLFVAAKVALARRQYEDAIGALRRAIDQRRDWAQAHSLLGSALFLAGDAETARGELVRAIELDPNHADAYKMLSRAHAKLGDHGFAVEAGERGLAQDPGDVATRIHVVQSLVQERRFDEALERLLAIPDEQRGTTEVQFAIGRVYVFREEWANARRHLGLALEAQPNSADVLEALAQLDTREGKLADAYERVRAARAENPDDAKLQTLFGDLSLASGRSEDAESAYRRAIEIDPNGVAAYTKLAGLFLAAQRAPEAVDTYQRAIQQSPQSGSLHLMLASLLEAGGRLEEAVRHYERAIELDPDLALAKNNLAYLMAERGTDLERALELAQEAKAKLPDDPTAADTLGWVLYKKKVPDAAIGYLREAVGALPPEDPNLPLVRHHLALAYEANDERELSIAALEQAVAELDRGKAEGAQRPEPAWAQSVRADLERMQVQ